MNKPLLILAGAVAALGVASAANAAVVYTSNLEWKDNNPVSLGGPFGQVTLTEVDATHVQVQVDLFSPEVGFLNTGGPHDPFLFNMNGNYQVTVAPNGPNQTFFDGGFDSDTTTAPNFESTPFGNFTNKIGCCIAPNNELNGGSHKSLPPLIFTVFDSNGITFAGQGATFDSNGRLLTLGTGDHFLSNSGGWWFAADLVDSSGATFNVAARDAFRGAVPEPATWAMMLLGFGGMGAVLRSQRRRRAAALT